MPQTLRAKVRQLADDLNVNLQVVSLDTLLLGVRVELEHGYVSQKTNITNNNLLKTIKIALAHLQEYPDYYKRLLKLEVDAERYWNRREKPNIWLD